MVQAHSVLKRHLAALDPPPRPKFELRWYQQEAIVQTYRRYHQGFKSIMLVMPTGSGKTLTAAHMIRDAASKGRRVLFLVHRENLIGQTVETLLNYDIPEYEVGFIKSGYPCAGHHERVIVASLQTLARRQYPENIGLVVFDEAHSTSFWSSSQQLIYHYAKAPVMPLSKCKFLHLTATPYRTKGTEYFGDRIEAIVKPVTIRQLIKEGSLVPSRPFGYGGILDLSKLDTDKSGDYRQSQLVKICLDDDFIADVTDKIVEFASDRKIVLFNAGVEQSERTTNRLNSLGIHAAHLQAETPQHERDAIYQRFRSGKIQCLSGVDIFTEGFDEKSCDCVVLARPTKSMARYVQMVGRGLRPFPSKTDCLVLDFGDCTKRLGRVELLGDRSVSLCPTPPSPAPQKECPDCHAMIPKLAKICPECGFVFPDGDCEEGSEPDDVLPFGELFDAETEKKIRYIRSQRKRRYTTGHPPDRLWDLWSDRYQTEILDNAWLFGAVFRGDRSENSQMRFRSYLSQFSQTPQWLEFHLQVEFGRPGDTYRTRKGSYSPPPLALPRTWREVLCVAPNATSDEIKFAYRCQLNKADGDGDAIALLNWALEQSEVL